MCRIFIVGSHRREIQRIGEGAAVGRVNSLDLYFSGRFAAFISRDDSGDCLLQYSDEWLSDPNAFPLSLSLPLQEDPHTTKNIEYILQGLLPENKKILSDWGRRYNIFNTSDAFEVLAQVGEDIAGAAQFVRTGNIPGADDLANNLRDKDVENLIAAIREFGGALPSHRIIPRAALSGLHEKIALAYHNKQWFLPDGNTPSTHIFKPASKQFRDIDRLEAAIMNTANKLGIKTATAGLVGVGSERAYVTARFDRTITPTETLRIHQEDIIQAWGLPPKKKYQKSSGPALADYVRFLREHSSNPDEDVRDLIRQTAFNVVVGNGDAHGKNHSLIIKPGGEVRLSPAYDIISVAPYPNYHQELALAIGDNYNFRTVGAKDWQKFSEDAGVDKDWVMEEVTRIWSQAPELVLHELQEHRAPGRIFNPVAQLLDTVPGRV